MSRAIPHRCANPLCACETREFTCSLWCGPLNLCQASRCLCRHEACAQPGSRVAGPPVGDAADLYPAVLDRFRLDRRAAAGGRR